MTRLRWALCGLSLVFGACAVSSGERTADSAATATDVQQVQTAYPAAASAAAASDVTCTETFGECKVVATCEGIPNDTAQRITETCCTAAGSCTTELYRLCGC